MAQRAGITLIPLATNEIEISLGWTVISMKNDWKRIFAFE
jgi:hypothetical protein